MKKYGLVWQIFTGMIVGIALGLLHKELSLALKPIGDIFINMIKMVIIPLVASALITSLSGIGNLKTVGKLGVKTLLYFWVVTSIAIIAGVMTIVWTHPGVGVTMEGFQSSAIESYVQTAKTVKPIDLITGIFPSNVIASAAEGKLLPVVFFSIMFGVALAGVGEKGKVVVNFFQGVFDTMLRMIKIVMGFAPFGVAAILASAVARFGFRTLVPLVKFLLIYYVTIAIFVVIVFGIIARLCGINIFILLRNIKEELLIGFSTTSSEAVMPQIIEKMIRFGSDRSTVSFVIPLGYSFNLDGAAFYQGMVIPFLAQMYGIPLSINQIIMIVLVLMVTSKGMAGVTGAGYVVLAATLSAVGLPLEGLALIIALDRPMDMARTLVNIVGYCLATIFISRWEGKFDMSKAILFSKMGDIAEAAVSN